MNATIEHPTEAVTALDLFTQAADAQPDPVAGKEAELSTLLARADHPQRDDGGRILALGEELGIPRDVLKRRVELAIQANQQQARILDLERREADLRSRIAALDESKRRAEEAAQAAGTSEAIIRAAEAAVVNWHWTWGQGNDGSPRMQLAQSYLRARGWKYQSLGWADGDGGKVPLGMALQRQIERDTKPLWSTTAAHLADGASKATGLTYGPAKLL